MLFRHKQPAAGSYDREHKTPVIRCSICTGEQVAGFQDRATGHFEEIMLLRDAQDLELFRSRYGIMEDIKHIY